MGHTHTYIQLAIDLKWEKSHLVETTSGEEEGVKCKVCCNELQ